MLVTTKFAPGDLVKIRIEEERVTYFPCPVCGGLGKSTHQWPGQRQALYCPECRGDGKSMKVKDREKIVYEHAGRVRFVSITIAKNPDGNEIRYYITPLDDDEADFTTEQGNKVFHMYHWEDNLSPLDEAPVGQIPNDTCQLCGREILADDTACECELD